MPPICLTLAEESLSVLEGKLETYVGTVPFIEVRLDYLRPFEIPRLPENGDTRFLATLRPTREGGRFDGPEPGRLRLLCQAAGRGFHLVDLEHDVEPFQLPPGVRVVRSLHDFSGELGLEHAFEVLSRRPADVYKLAVQVGTTRRLVELLDWRERHRHRTDLLALGMGEFGKPSRLLGCFLGNPWTYVAESGTTAVAPGQFTFQEAVDVYRFGEWQETPELYGVIGNPVSHSRSPVLHNRLFQHYGLGKLYLPLPLDDVAPWFDFLTRTELPFRGLSVTIPHKGSVVRYARPTDPPLAAANTMIWDDGEWVVANTDVEGFLRPLLARVSSLKGRKAVVLGNGGVAESVVPSLLGQGMEVVVAGRNPDRVRAFAQRYGCSWRSLSELLEEAWLCVNTTPVGQSPDIDDSPLEPSRLRFDVVYDLVYNPERTRLLTTAAAGGAETISGLEMFIEQAAGQFVHWTGLDPDRSLIREILEVKR
jgi:3-dehydroquinate dehydratase / shikimate dehydrogenase